MPQKKKKERKKRVQDKPVIACCDKIQGSWAEGVVHS
jgi:hypothetical protein